MADQERKLQESAPEKERFADQQFGAQAARDQERAESDTDERGPNYGEPSADTDADGGLGESATTTNPTPRAGNKAEPATD